MPSFLSESAIRSLLSSSKLLLATTKGFLGTTKQIRSYSQMPWMIGHSYVGERAYDIFLSLLKKRIERFNGPIIDETARVVTTRFDVARFLFFESENPSKPEPIYMYPAGTAVPAGQAMYDNMQYIRSINTVYLDQAASMGSILLPAEVKCKRRSLPSASATIMIRRLSGGYSGQATDMTIHTKQIIHVWDLLNALYTNQTGQPSIDIDIIQKNMDRDYFMTPEEAKEFWIILHTRHLLV